MALLMCLGMVFSVLHMDDALLVHASGDAQPTEEVAQPSLTGLADSSEQFSEETAEVVQGDQLGEGASVEEVSPAETQIEQELNSVAVGGEGQALLADAP